MSNDEFMREIEVAISNHISPMDRKFNGLS